MFGPLQRFRMRKLDDAAVLRCHMYRSRFAGNDRQKRKARADKETHMLLEQVLSELIFLENYPRTRIDIVFRILNVSFYRDLRNLLFSVASLIFFTLKMFLSKKAHCLFSFFIPLFLPAVQKTHSLFLLLQNFFPFHPLTVQKSKLKLSVQCSISNVSPERQTATMFLKCEPNSSVVSC